jgi:hypothetical protein
MKTTSKKTKIIGKETYVNQRTGEIEEHQVIQMTNTDFNFDKIWLGHILETLDMIGNQKIKVLNSENKKELLKKSNFIQLKDSLDLYLMQIEDVLFQNDLAPLEYVKPTIKQIVINKRKLKKRSNLR